MASIRTRLITAYAAALLITFAILSTAFYAVQRHEAQRALETQVTSDATFVLHMIQQAQASGEPIRLRIFLESVSDYVMLFDSTGQTLGSSRAVRQLSEDDQTTLQSAVARVPNNGEFRTVGLADRTTILVAARPVSAPQIARIVTGVVEKTEDIPPRDVLTALGLAVPVIALFSIVGAYVIAGHAFRPLDIMTNEVEAITDGRSLHRRLALSGTSTELTRLATTLNAMLGRLETSFGGLRRFTADASHELKTPLAVLRANIERALNAHPQSNEQLVALEEALVETRRMTDLVDSLLTLARADEGRFDIHREPVALDPIVREVYDAAVILGEDAGIVVSLPVFEPATILGDATRLRQLFMNLVINAIKYTPRGGHIDVALSHRLDGVTFSVRDTGIGIAGSDVPYIFDRFWRADRARSRASERGGFGLGLAISQWIAQAHGGSISVSSRLGRGTNFTVSLPFAPPPTPSSGVPTSSGAPISND